MAIAVVVEFTLKPGQHAAFDALIREHARLTQQEEPGCVSFDVLQPLANGAPDHSRVMLVEVYKDSAAFDAHGKNLRLAKVREAYKPMIADRKLHLCEM